jgi:hypothetical protein
MDIIWSFAVFGGRDSEVAFRNRHSEVASWAAIKEWKDESNSTAGGISADFTVCQRK